ncbi:hypothetical protein CXB51_032540 [Gossypium anomalum]|uniref:ABC transporter domain-containing protein n=1 Tax=Gossypium anomalum TaxID=47600 RepID=A0A8J6CMI3_9ROSI|nr:hypothetical protein CXB51_032540 [Gossypium anomalum]
MDSLQSLPPLSTLSTSVSSALNADLGTNHDLTQAPSIVAEFLTQCDDLERNLVHLNRTLESNLASYASFSNRIGHLFGIVNSKLTDLGSSVCLGSSVSDGEGLGEELPSLAKEVARVEAVRAYAVVVFQYAKKGREKVEQLLLESTTSYPIICDNLKKIYPARDGNPAKIAVRGLSLALPRGECFGMFGPNGGGKTSLINMMIGLTKPTSGTAYLQGLDILTSMDTIYTSMGVCPQHDLLWETLTGREHLLFYGRLKNLKGSALNQAVEGSLKSVNLFHGGVADKHAGKYSGGMKWRLSVAISLIGDPKVVFMDEPSTGLDPASRNSLWSVVKQAKRDRAIILTTHSMEEAEVLCDRLGIFVDGALRCIGNAKELKGRYGGSYIFTITTYSNNEEEVENMVQHLSPNANKIYRISGTQKFEMPKQEVRIADVFQAVENAKSRFTVFAWGSADTTLEDVFIKVARGAQAVNILS